MEAPKRVSNSAARGLAWRISHAHGSTYTPLEYAGPDAESPCGGWLSGAILRLPRRRDAGRGLTLGSPKERLAKTVGAFARPSAISSRPSFRCVGPWPRLPI